MEFKHYSVLLNETIEQLHIRPDGIYVDGTLGGGGHSLEICRHLTTGRLIGIDQDADAIAAATERLKDYADRVTIVRSNYAQMADVLKNLGIEKVDGIILDLGVSSFQLDTPERGFTYRSEDAPLDMRMDKRQRLTARDIVNDYSEAELFRIIRDYGEDRFAKNIAKHIVMEREKAPIETTGQLCEIIRHAIPMKFQKNTGHPAKRTFQAIRIEVNDELGGVKRAVDDFIDVLAPKGRLAIISFHSLEDRIVKDAYSERENPCVCPPEIPICVCGKKPEIKKINKKPIVPSESQEDENPRARSAKLRVCEKLGKR